MHSLSSGHKHLEDLATACSRPTGDDGVAAPEQTTNIQASLPSPRMITASDVRRHVWEHCRNIMTVKGAVKALYRSRVLRDALALELTRTTDAQRVQELCVEFEAASAACREKRRHLDMEYAKLLAAQLEGQQKLLIRYHQTLDRTDSKGMRLWSAIQEARAFDDRCRQRYYEARQAYESYQQESQTCDDADAHAADDKFHESLENENGQRCCITYRFQSMAHLAKRFCVAAAKLKSAAQRYHRAVAEFRAYRRAQKQAAITMEPVTQLPLFLTETTTNAVFDPTSFSLTGDHSTMASTAVASTLAKELPKTLSMLAAAATVTTATSSSPCQQHPLQLLSTLLLHRYQQQQQNEEEEVRLLHAAPLVTDVPEKVVHDDGKASQTQDDDCILLGTSCKQHTTEGKREREEQHPFDSYTCSVINMFETERRNRSPLKRRRLSEGTTQSLCHLFQELKQQLTEVTPSARITSEDRWQPCSAVLSAQQQNVFREALEVKPSHDVKETGVPIDRTIFDQEERDPAASSKAFWASSSSQSPASSSTATTASTSHSRTMSTAAVHRYMTALSLVGVPVKEAPGGATVITGLPTSTPPKCSEIHEGDGSPILCRHSQSGSDVSTVTTVSRKMKSVKPPTTALVENVSSSCHRNVNNSKSGATDKNFETLTYVYECLAAMDGVFTMKSKTYQTHLKAYLPEPCADQQRYILSITKPPLIPTNTGEMEVIARLRRLDDASFPQKRLPESSQVRVADLLEDFLTSIVNKMMFLLVVEHQTWYIHAPAREQLTDHLLEFIWPQRSIIQANFRPFFLNFVEVRVRHFRDSVARYFRERAKHTQRYNAVTAHHAEGSEAGTHLLTVSSSSSELANRPRTRSTTMQLLGRRVAVTATSH